MSADMGIERGTGLARAGLGVIEIGGMLMNGLKHFLAAGLLLCLAPAPSPASAQDAEQLRAQVNQGLVGIMCGRSTGALLPYCEDMAAVLNDNIGYQLRVVPMIGEGSMRNVEDILYLRGVDLALANADALEFMQQQNIHPAVKRKVGYIAAMSSSELHVVARREIASIYDLEGRTVNFSTPGSGTFLTMTNTFEALNINVAVTNDPEAVALDKLKRGEIDAMGVNASIPWGFAAQISAEDNLRLLNIPVDCLSGPYESVETPSSVYPQLIPADLTWTTPRVPVVLLAYQWSSDHPRCRRVARFADTLTSRIQDLRDGPFADRWRDVDLDAEIRGLDRWQGNCGQAAAGEG